MDRYRLFSGLIWDEAEARQIAEVAHKAECQTMLHRANQFEGLVAALEAHLAERLNIGEDKPFWTPGVIEQLRAAFVAAKGGE